MKRSAGLCKSPQHVLCVCGICQCMLSHTAAVLLVKPCATVVPLALVSALAERLLSTAGPWEYLW